MRASDREHFSIRIRDCRMTISTAAPPSVLADNTAQTLMSRAISIAAGLRDEARRLRGGDVAWLLTPSAPMDPHLYSGSTGIAWFLAALDHMRGTDDNRELITGATMPLRRRIRELAADPARASCIRMPIGGLVGIGAWIYGLVRIGRWIGDDALVTDAHTATALLTLDRVANDEQFDVTRGAAGTVMALVALHDAGGAPYPDRPLELAMACANHLLRTRAPHEGSARAWWVGGQAPRNGFAHGASGIATALLRLHARTGNDTLREAALEAFEYERELWDPSVANWWDPHYNQHLQLQSWCFGAPGTLLARLEAVAGDDWVAGGEDMETALTLTRAYPDEPVDHLCCGNFGRAEVLATASARLDRPHLLESARQIALRALARAPRDIDFGFTPPGTAPLLRLSLFRGLAGIGYALAHLAQPGRLPTPLAME